MSEMRLFIVRVQDVPTNHNRPRTIRCSSMGELLDELDTVMRGTHWVKELVDGEEKLHLGKVWKDGGQLVDSCYFYPETQVLHESHELRSAIATRREKKIVFA